jgi:4-nitrophenyl phosphatase
MQGAVIDLDGTVYRSTDPVSDVPETIETLRDRGVDIIFASNTSTKSRATCQRRLRNIGIAAEREEILTSASVTAKHVATTYEGQRVFAVGSAALFGELADAGIQTTDDPQAAEAIVVGKDRDIDWEGLTRVVRAAVRDVPFVATNRDRVSPTSSGIVPGTGTLVAAVAWAANREPDTVTGKPHDPMIDAIAERLDCELSEAFVIGDNIESDIALGERAGIPTVLVLSGVAAESDLDDASTQPTHVLDSLADVERFFTV